MSEKLIMIPVLLPFLLLLSMSILSQEYKESSRKFACHTDESNNLGVVDRQSQEELRKLFIGIIEEENKKVQPKSNGLIVIPVVFHVPGKFKSDQISLNYFSNIIRTANLVLEGKGVTGYEEPSRMHIIFQNLIKDSRIRLCLAKKGPDDENLNGIRYYPSTEMGKMHETIENFDRHRRLSEVRYLNIWADIPTASAAWGESDFPDSYYSGGHPGLPVSEQKKHQGDELGLWLNPLHGLHGFVLAHELGHKLGLFHISQKYECNEVHGDYLKDTPVQKRWQSDDYEVINQVESYTCPDSELPDMFINPMGQTMMFRGFTHDQTTVMQYHAKNEYSLRAEVEASTLCYTQEELEELSKTAPTLLGRNINFSIFPNPVKKNEKIAIGFPNETFFSKSKQSIKISLYDSTGRRLQSKEIDIPSLSVENGKLIQYIDAPRSPGMYFLNIEVPNQALSTMKIVVSP